MDIVANTSGRKTFPLFPNLPPPCPRPFERDDGAIFDGFGEDPFLTGLALSAPVQRLKQISFLGALDYIRFPNDNSRAYCRHHNRYEHSIGVARLALVYAGIRKLNRRDTRVLAAAGILHDIGHGPLSHTLEPIFKSEFNISHHRSGENILYGRSPFGKEIMKIMSAHGVDLDEVAAMIEGRHEGPHAFLYSGPINLDTIEGISRSHAFAAKSNCRVNPYRFVAALAKHDEPPIKLTDEFWRMKHEIYNIFIHNEAGLVLDGLAQAYMRHNIEEFSPDDFLKTEDQLRRRQPTLFHVFAWARKSIRRACHHISEHVPEVFEFSLRAPRRNFTIETSVAVHRPADLRRRYKQSKSFRNITIGQLVANEHIPGTVGA